MSSEIDAIFSQKPKKIEKQPTSDRKPSKKKKTEILMPPPDSPKPVRFDDDGLAIYTEESLGLSLNLKGGGTELCPFDCKCCY